MGVCSKKQNHRFCSIFPFTNRFFWVPLADTPLPAVQVTASKSVQPILWRRPSDAPSKIIGWSPSQSTCMAIGQTPKWSSIHIYTVLLYYIISTICCKHITNLKSNFYYLEKKYQAHLLSPEVFFGFSDNILKDQRDPRLANNKLYLVPGVFMFDSYPNLESRCKQLLGNEMQLHHDHPTGPPKDHGLKKERAQIASIVVPVGSASRLQIGKCPASISVDKLLAEPCHRPTQPQLVRLPQVFAPKHSFAACKMIPSYLADWESKPLTCP